jgi:hypothetical protein
MLLGEIPDYMPSFFEPHSAHIAEELLTPVFAPDGPIVTSLGVTYVGSPENNFGAMPAPGKVLLEDVTKWRDVVKLPDLTGRDWEGYYTRQVEKLDRENLAVTVTGGDYFLTLVSLMGFENALIAMYEEPEEVEALLQSHLGDTLQLTSRPDPKFGEALVMLSTQPVDEERLRRLLAAHPYWMPRDILHIDRLPRTATGKPDRAEAKRICLKQS